MYHIAGDPIRACLRVTTRGFWTIPEATAFVAELEAQSRKLLSENIHLNVLLDASETPAQSPDVANLIVSTWQTLLVDANIRVAVVSDDAIARLQAKRLFQQVRYQAFECVADAEKWLSTSW